MSSEKATTDKLISMEKLLLEALWKTYFIEHNLSAKGLK